MVNPARWHCDSRRGTPLFHAAREGKRSPDANRKDPFSTPPFRLPDLVDGTGTADLLRSRDLRPIQPGCLETRTKRRKTSSWRADGGPVDRRCTRPRGSVGTADSAAPGEFTTLHLDPGGAMRCPFRHRVWWICCSRRITGQLPSSLRFRSSSRKYLRVARNQLQRWSHLDSPSRLRPAPATESTG